MRNRRAPRGTQRFRLRRREILDRVAHGAEDLADLAAQEDEGNDGHDRDEGEDQRVLREALAFLVTIEEVHDCKIDRRHEDAYLLPSRRPGLAEGCATVRAGTERVKARGRI